MKKWYASKTIWFNLLFGALGLFQSVTGTVVLDQDAMTAVGTAGNLLLRAVTSKSLT